MTTQVSERPVLVVGALEYLHAAPGMTQPGLWPALTTQPENRNTEQVACVYEWLLQLRTEALLQRLRPETLYQLARHSLEACFHSTFDILCRQGEPSSCAYLLVAGSISVWFDRSIPNRANQPKLLPPPPLAIGAEQSSGAGTPVYALKSAVARYQARRASVASVDVSALHISVPPVDDAVAADSQPLQSEAGDQPLSPSALAQLHSPSGAPPPQTRRHSRVHQRRNSTVVEEAAAAAAAAVAAAAEADELMSNELSGWQTLHVKEEAASEAPTAAGSPKAHLLLSPSSSISLSSPANRVVRAHRRTASAFSFDSPSVRASGAIMSPSNFSLGSPKALTVQSGCGDATPASVVAATEAAAKADAAAQAESEVSAVAHRHARVGDRMPGHAFYHAANAGPGDDDISDRETECVGLIKAGSERFTLGELGLIENIARTASLRAEESVLLLRVDAAVFNRLVRKDLMHDLHTKVDALRACPLVSALDAGWMKRLSLHFRVHEFRAQQTLYSAGDPIVHLYLIIEGQCDILHEPVSASSAPSIAGRLGHGNAPHINLSTCFAGQFVGCEQSLFDSDESRLAQGAMHAQHSSLRSFQTKEQMKSQAQGWFATDGASAHKKTVRRNVHVAPASTAGGKSPVLSRAGDKAHRNDAIDDAVDALVHKSPEAMLAVLAARGYFELHPVRQSGVRHEETARAATHLRTIAVSAIELSTALPPPQLQALANEARARARVHRARLESMKNDPALRSKLNLAAASSATAAASPASASAAVDTKTKGLHRSPFAAAAAAALSSTIEASALQSPGRGANSLHTLALSPSASSLSATLPTGPVGVPPPPPSLDLPGPPPPALVAPIPKGALILSNAGRKSGGTSGGDAAAAAAAAATTTAANSTTAATISADDNAYAQHVAAHQNAPVVDAVQSHFGAGVRRPDPRGPSLVDRADTAIRTKVRRATDAHAHKLAASAVPTTSTADSLHWLIVRTNLFDPNADFEDRLQKSPGYLERSQNAARLAQQRRALVDESGNASLAATNEACDDDLAVSATTTLSKPFLAPPPGSFFLTDVSPAVGAHAVVGGASASPPPKPLLLSASRSMAALRGGAH